MKYTCTLLILCLFMPVSIFAYDTKDTLHIYVDNSQPYAYTTPSGASAGVLIDLIDSLFEDIHRPYKVVIKDSLNRDSIGHYPCCITPQGIWRNLSTDTAQYSHLLFHSTGGILHKDGVEVDNIFEMKHSRICVRDKAFFLHEMQTYGIHIAESRICTYQSIDEAIHSLTIGKCDCVLADYLKLYWYVQNKDLKNINLVDVQTLPKIYMLHFSNDVDPELIKAFDKNLEAKIQAGTIDKVFETWFGHPHQKRLRQAAHRLYKALFLLPVLIILLIWGIYSLQKKRKANVRVFEEFTDILMDFPHGVDIYINGSDKSSYRNKKSVYLEKEAVLHPNVVCCKEENIYFPYNNKSIHIKVTVDMTELNKAKIKTERNSQIKTQFLANTSHDLRSPLNAIVGFASMLSECHDEQEMEEYAHIIETNTHNLLRLLDSVIELSHLQTTIDFQLTRKRYDFYKHLHMLVKEYELYLQQIHKSDIKLSLTTNFDELIIMADSAYVQRVLSNILSNACKYTNEGTIAMNARFEPDLETLFFSVEDTGVGMSENKLAVLFTKEDVHSELQDNSFGFGLTICKTILDHVHGKIAVHSKEGEGTRVDIQYHPKTISYHLKE